MTLDQPPLRKRSIHNARIAGLYDLEQTIGKGHFAVVKLARHVFTGEKVACKIIDKANLDPQSRTSIMQEVRCMKLVQHPNIVRLYEVIDTQTKLFLCLELGDYDMHDFIIKHEKGVNEPLAQQYFCQIITAIDYCHKLHVVHRDLKPENVVFFEKLGMVKLTDFGFSNLYEPGQQLRTSCGSLAYSAPEILLGDAYDAPAVDVWSLGVILYMLVCGRLPFNETNDSETLTKILDCKYSFPDYLSVLCKNLITRMLVRDPSKRAGLPEIVTNAWVSAGDRGHAQELPLIVQHHLSHSAHTTIIDQMVAGNIGSEDAILSALENDEYNSMTATYFLLAERILSSCREEKAKELMEKENMALPEEEPLDGGDNVNKVAPNPKCRSRSNSWRARPCTILKEESEEELSTYLRSTSRQSSRLVSPGNSTRGRCSRQASEDNCSVRSGDFIVERPVHLALSRLIATPSTFDDLSPILEDMAHKIGRRRKIESMGSVETSIRRALFGRTISEPEWLEKELEIFKDDRPNCRLVRRNSSPSVSMFSGSTKDRISPQQVQDLLEFSRIGARRAASPDSVRSSRSPSPPASSSGRTSPAISSLSSFSRLKVAPSTSSSGMRKLSSSPHLLGICEEGEEGGDNTSAIAHLSNPMDGISRTNRSASTGLVHMARHGPVQATKSTGSHPQPTTYSAVRMIRPRHAVVSPDVCRRYEQHQRFINRSRRSTSCSSSEASDDEEGKRLSLISKHCGLKKDRDRRSDDDDSSNGGLNGGGPPSNVIFSLANASGNGTNSNTTNGGERSSENRGAADTVTCTQPTLMPIPEMPQLDSDKGERIRAKFLHRSQTAERVLRDWAGIYSKEEDCWLGTPPRDTVSQGENKTGELWIRKLQRTRSHGDISTMVLCHGDEGHSSVIDSMDCELLDFSESSSNIDAPNRRPDSDSGCSSSKAREKTDIKKPSYSLLDPCLVFDQPRLEKVDSWLRRSQFV